MYSDDIYILHLSDLHIRNIGDKEHPCYSASLSKLILDIEDQIKKIRINNLIITITGDIIDSGLYDIHRVAALLFFNDLYKRLNLIKIIKEIESGEDKFLKVIDVIITPGNHDKCRNPIDSLVSNIHAENGLDFDDYDVKEKWKFQLKSFKKYMELANKIRNIFGIFNKDIDNTFGIDLVGISEKTNVCFLRIDTSWCSYTKSSENERHLRVGKYQLDMLNKEYEKLSGVCEARGNPIILTIALLHHPLSHLKHDDEELCYKYFLSKKYLNVDILMCGHIHNGEVKNFFSYDNSLLTLITGVGLKNKSPYDINNNEIGEANQRYSIYLINHFRNSCEIIMRKENSDNSFNYDYSAYSENENSTTIVEKIRFPLKININNAPIIINSQSEIEKKSLFLTSDILKKLPQITVAVSAFSKNIAYLKDADIELLEINKNKDQEEIFTIKQEKFVKFLIGVCKNSVIDLGKELFNPETEIRAHCRYFDEQDNTYPAFCQYPDEDESNKTKTIRTAVWDSLIKRSFISKLPIIQSANAEYSSITNSDWRDNITFVPHYKEFIKHFDILQKDGRKKKERRPILTFCFSIKNNVDEDTLMLYLLAHLRIDKTMSRIIDDYIKTYNINSNEFLDYMQKLHANENYNQ